MTPLRQAIRALRAAPVFTVTALATLAICLGASLTIFALVDAVLLRPLPYPEADRLVTMYHASSTNARPRTGATPSVAKNSGATRPSRSRDVAPVRRSATPPGRSRRCVWTSSLLSRLLFEISPTSPAALGLVAAGLAGIATIACAVPAVRAARVSPLVALRK